ncbi:MAG: glycosyltransferase [Acidobacteriales bacterium]|nr:glycosyltransferase [Terriglobales bacterium]
MVGTTEELVSVLITTFNSAATLAACLESVHAQNHSPLEIIIVDNASSDATRELLRSAPAGTRVIMNPQNVGFAAAQNQAIQAARGVWLLSLNPDVLLHTDFVSRLVAAGRNEPQVGTMCGKLLRWQPRSPMPKTNILDSTGMYFQRNLRHLDRGSGELDRGQYQRAEYVFGATGAAALYRRAMVEDVAIEGEFFDEEFFAYREDADLAWRAQLFAWKCLYIPEAVGWHQRRVTPERRSQLPLVINWHSVKNRFLMRIKNISLPLYARLFVAVTLRDSMVAGYALLRNWRLLSALLHPIRRWSHLMRKRRLIQARRRVSDRDLACWFSNSPVSEPFEWRRAADSTQGALAKN